MIFVLALLNSVARLLSMDITIQCRECGGSGGIDCGSGRGRACDGCGGTGDYTLMCDEHPRREAVVEIDGLGYCHECRVADSRRDDDTAIMASISRGFFFACDNAVTQEMPIVPMAVLVSTIGGEIPAAVLHTTAHDLTPTLHLRAVTEEDIEAARRGGAL